MCSGGGNPELQGVGKSWVGVLPSSDLVLEKWTKGAGVEGREALMETLDTIQPSGLTSRKGSSLKAHLSLLRPV